MTSLAITGGTALVEGNWIEGDVAINGTTVTSIGPASVDSARRIDASGCSVLPGFIDLQVNGAASVDLTSCPERIGEVAAFLVSCGVTAFMPTVISSPLETQARAIEVMHEWSRQRTPGAKSIGVHLEGPYLNPLRGGAHPRQHLRSPSIAESKQWRNDAGVAMVTLAPELPGALDVIELLVANGVTVCAGHTDASHTELGLAVGAGLRGVTHLFNAMTPMSARQPGPAGASLTDPRLIAGMIVDGVHVDRAMVRLAWRALGPSQVVLVSDSVSALGMAPGTYAVGDTTIVVDDTAVRTAEGVLAGSLLRLDDAVRNLIAFTGCTLAEASLAASATPARLAGRADIGQLLPGCAADVVLLDGDLRVVATVVDGRVVFDPQQRCADS